VLVAVGRDVLHRVIRLPPLIGHSSRRVGGQHSRAGGMCALLPGVMEGQGLSSIYIKIARDRAHRGALVVMALTSAKRTP
jgi:hypothetical protein